MPVYRTRNDIRNVVIVVGILLFSNFALWGNSQDRPESSSNHVRLELQVQYELIILSNYSVFDSLEFEILDGDSVTLSGRVTRPSLKSDAESTIRRLEGIGKVVNKIEVLPISPGDERIRLAVYRAFFDNTDLSVYVIRAVPPIHFIVENGNVTLIGLVATQAEKDMAEIAVGQVPGVFSVVNNLRIKRGNL
jgi:hyperosmotically inducible protein